VYAIESFNCRALRWCKSSVCIFSRTVAASQNHDHYCYYYIYDNDDDRDGVGSRDNKTTTIRMLTTIMYRNPILTLRTAALHHSLHKDCRQNKCENRYYSDHVRMHELKPMSEWACQTALSETSDRVTVPAREPECVQEQKGHTSVSSMG